MTDSATDGTQVEFVSLTAAEHEGRKHGLVHLQEKNGDRVLSIIVGEIEAVAIARAVQGESVLRPMTHDMLKQAIVALGGELRAVTISHDPQSGVFLADATLVLDNGDERHIDCRPSDALALAVRTDPTPAIVVPDDLLVAPSG